MKQLGRFFLAAILSFWVVVFLGAFGYSMGTFALGGQELLIALFWSLLANLEVGCAEESLFRYLIMDLLFERRLKIPKGPALVASALLFGAAHLLNGPWPGQIPQACETFVMGLFFGHFYRRYGLWAPILMHATFDFFVTFVMPVVGGHA